MTIIQLFKQEKFARRFYGACQRCEKTDYLPWATEHGVRYCGQCWEKDCLEYTKQHFRPLPSPPEAPSKKGEVS